MGRNPSQWPIFRFFLGGEDARTNPSAQHNIEFHKITKPDYDPRTLSIRPAGITDVQFIMTLESAPENTDQVDNSSFMVHSQNICSGDYSYFIIESAQDVRPLGFVILHAPERDGVVILQRIVVWAKAKGIGSFFIRGLISRLQNDPDFEKMILYIKQTKSGPDMALIEFWENAGFQIDEDRHFQSRGHIMMSKDLQSSSVI